MKTKQTSPTKKTAAKKTAAKKTEQKTAPKVAKVAKKSARKAPSPNQRGVTEMTKEKHNFNGFSVRAQKSGHVFRQYITASGRKRSGSTDEACKAEALEEANALRVKLGEIIDDKKSWSDEGGLKSSAAKAVSALGFKHESPKL